MHNAQQCDNVFHARAGERESLLCASIILFARANTLNDFFVLVASERNCTLDADVAAEAAIRAGPERESKWALLVAFDPLSLSLSLGWGGGIHTQQLLMRSPPLQLLFVVNNVTFCQGADLLHYT